MKIFISLVVLMFSFVVFVRYFEATAIFHPTREMPVAPDFVGLEFEDIYFKTQDQVTLNGWFVKNRPASSVVLYLHGNAGNISHRLEKILMFHELGLNVFIIDYRGYGKSQGKPTEDGLYQDALAAYEYLKTRKDVNTDKIIAYGDSLGAVAAIDLATKRKLSCLVVDSSFTSSADMSKTIFPLVPSFLLATKMDSASKIKTVKIPKLFIHSINDEIVPFRLGKKLYESSADPKEFLQITGGHNTNHIDSRALLIKGFSDFFRKLNLI